MDIIFTNTSGVDLERYKPQSAKHFMPDWYKQTESYIAGEKKPVGNGSTSATIKRCVPVFDAMTAGYIITTFCDVYVSQKDGAPWYEWPSFSPIDFHPIEQASLHPDNNGFPFPKWINPWAIRTEKNWSVLLIPPMHRENQPFACLPGIVDTDSYYAPVNFPFTLRDSKFEGLIPAGTPLVQVIPIKRDSWTLRFGKDKEINEQNELAKSHRTVFFDAYRKRHWFRKEFN